MKTFGVDSTYVEFLLELGRRVEGVLMNVFRVPSWISVDLGEACEEHVPCGQCYQSWCSKYDFFIFVHD